MSAAKKRAPSLPTGLPRGYEVVDEALWRASATCNRYSSVIGYSCELATMDDAALAAIGLARGNSSTEPETAPLVMVDDLFDVDPETGEILAVRTPDSGFAIDSPERADWVLGKLMALDAEAAALQGADVVQQAKAILANAERMTAAVARRREALLRRFEAELAEFARKQLEGSKSRTWQGLYGAVSLRSVPARIAVSDPDQAAAILVQECPSALSATVALGQLGDGVEGDIARRTFLDLLGEHPGAVTLRAQISSVPKGLQAELAARHTTGFTRVEETESVTIRSGVES